MSRRTYEEQNKEYARALIPTLETMLEEGSTRIKRNGVDLCFCEGDVRQGNNRVQSLIRRGLIPRSPSDQGARWFDLPALLASLKAYVGNPVKA